MIDLYDGIGKLRYYYKLQSKGYMLNSGNEIKIFKGLFGEFKLFDIHFWEICIKW